MGWRDYELARNEPNIELLMNCSCLDCEMDGDAVRSVRGWQLTTQTFHEVHGANIRGLFG